MNNASSIHAILPLLIILITGMVVLVGDACLNFWRRSKLFSAAVALTGVAIAGLAAISGLTEGGSHLAFNGAIAADPFSQACNLILIIVAGLAILIAMTYLQNRDLHLAEYYALVLFSTSGAMLMASANDLIVLFIAVEILSVALYVLAGFARTEARSEEAALKYFLLGAFAAGFLLYGIALIYGGSAGATAGGSGAVAAGTTNLTVLASFLTNLTSTHNGPPVMLLIGIGLLFVGLAFKAGLAPFHMWTPDVYEGAPTSVTAFMAAAAKIGAFAAILRVFNALSPISPYWLVAIQIVAVLTMFGGNILAVTQDNVKRMLAYSSIAHSGYLMVAVSAVGAMPRAGLHLQAAHNAAMSGAIFYLLAYALMTLGSFGVLVWLTHRGKDYQTIGDLKGLWYNDPAAAYTMLIFLCSLGGIPGTMGFMGKWFLFYASLQAGQVWLAVTMAAASVISIAYYLRIAATMCFADPDSRVEPVRARATGGVFVAVAITASLSVLFGVAPGLVHSLMTAATALARP
jgi:NADH-quinone oxidoreductase subunit N